MTGQPIYPPHGGFLIQSLGSDDLAGGKLHHRRDLWCYRWHGNCIGLPKVLMNADRRKQCVAPGTFIDLDMKVPGDRRLRKTKSAGLASKLVLAKLDIHHGRVDRVTSVD